MAVQIGLARTGLVTDVTLVRFLARVHEHVGVQLGLLAEGHQALLALVRSFARVNHGVPDQFRLPLVRLFADVTGVRLLAAVGEHVIAERRLLGEGSVAEGTLEMLVAHRVQRQMHVQFRLLLKCLEADRALVRPAVRRRVVRGHVTIQIELLLECHMTDVALEKSVVVHHLLAVQACPLHENLLQRVAVVRFVEHVQLHVISQAQLVGESLLANVTLQRAHTDVGQHVGVQAAVVGEALLTDLTLTSAAVHLQMHHHGVIVQKPFLAN